VAQDLYLKVVRGNPTPEELAALIMVLTARAASLEPEEPPVAVPAWIDCSRHARRPVAPAAGAGAWRVAGWR
jgi:hypothetical protein